MKSAAAVAIALIRRREPPSADEVVKGALYVTGEGKSPEPLQMFLGDDHYKLKPIGGSAAAAGYVHSQGTEALEWIVNHNLGYKPLVSVLVDGVTEADALVTHSSVNQVRIEFLLPRKGSARLV